MEDGGGVVQVEGSKIIGKNNSIKTIKIDVIVDDQIIDLIKIGISSSKQH